MPTGYPLPPLPKGAVMASTDYQDDIAHLEKVATGPKPVKYDESWPNHMARVHIYLFTLLERTYRFAEWAHANDKLEDYLGFADVSLYYLELHHELEEKITYPGFEASSGLNVWGRNLDQHHAFQPALVAARIYVRRCRAQLNPRLPCPTPPPTVDDIAEQYRYPELNQDEPTFNPTLFRQHLDSFLGVLVKHMVEELETLDKQYISKVAEADEKKVKKAEEAHFRKLDPSWAVTCLFVSQDWTSIDIMFGGVPWILKYILIPLLWGRKYRDWWAFAPYPEHVSLWGIIKAEWAARSVERSQSHPSVE